MTDVPSVAVDNERLKLRANALDRASTASAAVGIFTPLAAFLQGQATPSWGLGPTILGWLATTLVLHYGAHRVLGRLK